MIEIDSEETEETVEWPNTKDVPYEILASKVVEFCQELNKREKDSRKFSLAAALKIWPNLHEALNSVGRRVALNNAAEPVLPEWTNEPVVPLDSWIGKKPKNKTEVMKIALTIGDGRWATIGDLWLWVGGGGPIVDRTLEMYGFLKPKSKNTPH